MSMICPLDSHELPPRPTSMHRDISRHLADLGEVRLAADDSGCFKLMVNHWKFKDNHPKFPSF